MLHEIVEYCVLPGLSLNCDKTQAMSIGKTEIREKYKDLVITFDDQPLKFDKKINLLGVVITEDLELDTFINETA